MKVIIIGDVVGKPGRNVLTASLKGLKEKYEAEFVIANVENAAEGAGLVPRVGDEILNAGVDVMTSGNHIFDKKDVIPYIENQPRLLRPANYAPDAPEVENWLRLYRNLYQDRTQAGDGEDQVPGTQGERAWRGLVTAMLRSPRILIY